jgi:hypothetical protein
MSAYDLTCEVVTASTDADGDSVTYTFAWDVDGVEYTGATDAATSSFVDGADVGGGETWTCEVEAGDGDAAGGRGEDSVTTQECTSLSLDGVNDYLNVPSSSSLVYAGARTVETWLNWRGGTGKYQFIAGQGWGGASIAFRLQVLGAADAICGGSAGKLILSWGPGGSTSYCLVSSATLSTGTWQHVAVVYNGSSWTMYIDGVSVGSRAASSVPTGAGYAAYIGGINLYPTDYPLNGSLGSVRLSTTARYSGSFTPAVDWTADSSTALLLRMEDGSGTAASDASGNGNDASISGATWASDCPTD